MSTFLSEYGNAFNAMGPLDGSISIVGILLLLVILFSLPFRVYYTLGGQGLRKVWEQNLGWSSPGEIYRSYVTQTLTMGVMLLMCFTATCFTARAMSTSAPFAKTKISFDKGWAEGVYTRQGDDFVSTKIIDGQMYQFTLRQTDQDREFRKELATTQSLEVLAIMVTEIEPYAWLRWLGSTTTVEMVLKVDGHPLITDKIWVWSVDPV